MHTDQYPGTEPQVRYSEEPLQEHDDTPTPLEKTEDELIKTETAPYTNQGNEEGITTPPNGEVEANNRLKTDRKPLSSNYGCFFIYCLVLLVFIVGWGFSFNMNEIKLIKLEQFLKELNYRYLYIEAELIEHERFNTIQQKVEHYGLNLELSTAPPYELTIPQED